MIITGCFCGQETDLSVNFCIFYTKNFTFFHQTFYTKIFTSKFLHHKFYTKIFEFFTPKFLNFLHQILRKILEKIGLKKTKKMFLKMGIKIWCKKIGVKKQNNVVKNGYKNLV